jgi:hypothetical protein
VTELIALLVAAGFFVAADLIVMGWRKRVRSWERVRSQEKETAE